MHRVIFGVDGRWIKTLKNEFMVAGRHTVIWTGRDDKDDLVAAGIRVNQVRTGPRRLASSLLQTLCLRVRSPMSLGLMGKYAWLTQFHLKLSNSPRE